MKNTKVVVRGSGAVLVAILRIPSLVFDMTNDLISFFDRLVTLDWFVSFRVSCFLIFTFGFNLYTFTLTYSPSLGFCKKLGGLFLLFLDSRHSWAEYSLRRVLFGGVVPFICTSSTTMF